MENLFMNWDYSKKTHVLSELSDVNGEMRFIPLANFQSLGELNLFRAHLFNHPTLLERFQKRYDPSAIVRYVDYSRSTPRFVY